MTTKKIILLKSKDGADDYADCIINAGHNCFFEPVLTVDYLKPDVTAITDKNPLIFTSAHGVESLVRCYDGRQNPVYAVGDVTAKAAKGAGFTDIMSADGNAEDLAQILLQKLDKTGVYPPFYICAQEISFDLGGFLLKNGINVQEIIGYNTNTAVKLSIELLKMLDNREIKAVMIFSAKGGQAFADLIEQYGRDNKLRGVMALCIAPSVVKSVSVLPFEKILIAQTPNRHGMMDLLNTISIA